jgi:septal ring factor EnvC (AmiA/AmiB activator)
MMNKLLCLNILMAVFFYSIFNAQGQKLSKEETKQIQKELKDLQKNLPAFRKMLEDNADLDKQLNDKRNQINALREKQTTLNQDDTKKDDAIAYLEEQLRKLRKDVGEVNATRQGRGDIDCSFAVQIGAYKNKDLTKYMDQSPNFGVETDPQGLKRYTLGFFTSYWEAKSFAVHLDKLGGQTYVVGYYKGERVPDLKDMTQCTF